ncbi:MAG: multidrug effflux MFS transporter [Bacteroidota bacterium]|nr:multidrug effflux MFS transporter [Bacteroidota bacterium]
MRKIASISFPIILMGFLVGLPALTTDIYLPGFPALTKFFGTSASEIQISLMATMIGIATGQLIIGPLSDKYGRKSTLWISLLLFLFSTLLCIYSKNVQAFIVFRFIQGFSCSGGMVISRAVLTDTYSGQDFSRALSVNTAILGFTPAVAPILGGIILTFAPWQGEFVFLLGMGLIFLFCSLGLKESLPREKRNSDLSNNMINNLLVTLKNKTFLLYVLIFSFSMSVLFAFISSSPFIFQEYYKLSPLVYSLFFGTNTIAITAGTLLSSCFKNERKTLYFGASGLLIMSIITSLILILVNSYIIFEISIFIMFLFTGLINPIATAMALKSNRELAGTASAILGASSFFFGGVMCSLAGIGNILYATSIALNFCALLVFSMVFRFSPSYAGIKNIKS